ncbi:DUF2092 domain-containing protein [Fundidesulfovibrio soli]|uniref:DUF2092 domain-containing protein n=1 Tax=Fundidesulfovibrio soli TaxID=2922716 RepID=UPI001FAFDD59|nr:DUF2092 domain-containing protein [Fundidesulfovibrio soli]
MSFSVRIRMGIAVLALAALLPGMAAAADKSQPREAQSRLDPQALDILEKSCKALTALKEFSFQANVALDKVYEDGSKVQFSRVMHLNVRRPDAFRVVTAGDDLKAASFFDGKTFTVLQPDKKIWSQIPAEMTIDAVLDRLADMYGLESPLGDLIVSQPCARLKMTAAVYVGKAVVGHTVCDHLFFQGPGADWQLWVPEKGPALPAKMLITYTSLPRDPQFQAVFSAWKEGPIAAKTFAFTAPEGTTRDDSLFTPLEAKPAGKAKRKAAAKTAN